MQNITRQLRDNQSRKNDSIPLSALTYNAPAGYAPLTYYIYSFVFMNVCINILLYILWKYLHVFPQCHCVFSPHSSLHHTFCGSFGYSKNPVQIARPNSRGSWTWVVMRWNKQRPSWRSKFTAMTWGEGWIYMLEAEDGYKTKVKMEREIGFEFW